MRYCEAGACTKKAVYRGPMNDRRESAWCEEHVEREGDDDLPKQEIELILGNQKEVKP